MLVLLNLMMTIFKAPGKDSKVIETPKESALTLEIIETLKEVKQIQEGKLGPLSLKDIN